MTSVRKNGKTDAMATMGDGMKLGSSGEGWSLLLVSFINELIEIIVIPEI